MSIEFICPSCQTTLRVSPEHAGKKAKCPHCQAVAQVPAQSGARPVQQPIKTPQPVQTPKPVNPYGEQPQNVPPANPYGNPGAAPAGNPYLSAPTANPYQQPASVNRPNYQVAHRGPMILILGLMAIFCNIAMVPGILAWVLGRGDIKQMDSGKMDPSGRGMTMAGMIIGMVMTCLILVVLAIYACIIVAVIVGGVANMN